MNEPRAEADGLLAEIAEIRARIERFEKAYERDLEQVRQEYEIFITPQREDLAAREKALVRLMKKQTAEIFDGHDKVTLPHGWLLHERGEHVTIPRDALERIEAKGWLDAVKVAKSVDREVVEKWPVERLFAIGAERKPTEKFEYELKAQRTPRKDDRDR